MDEKLCPKSSMGRHLLNLFFKKLHLNFLLKRPQRFRHGMGEAIGKTPMHLSYEDQVVFHGWNLESVGGRD